ncbi:MAG: RT0821/Lpp0805 family surface protein [Betaproteobacteria bacterium]
MNPNPHPLSLRRSAQGRTPAAAPRRVPTLATAVCALACAAVLVLTLAGCQTSPSQQQSGTVIGGVLGGALGSQIGHGSGRAAATVIGTLIGATIGGNVGRSMDHTDRLKTAQALESVNTGRSSSWHNPDTGAHYTVTPTRTRQTPEGPCREYTVDATVGGQPERVYGQACRQPDGSWRAMP